MENSTQCNVDHSINGLDGSWVEHMTKELEKASHEEASLVHTIYRVPESIRQVDVDTANVYEPYIISFGPYHHGKSNLQAMEEHKWRCLYRYLSRNTTKSLVDCLKELKEKETEMRSCYSERIEMVSNDFVEMMMLDGCFILEYLLYRDLLPDRTIWFYSRLQHDMLLLENQIPFFILQWLCNMIEMPNNDPLWVWAIYFVTNGALSISARISGEIHHLLHLYHSYFLPVPQSPKHSNPSDLHPTVKSMLKKMKQVVSLLRTNLLQSLGTSTPSSGKEVPSQSQPATPSETPSSANEESSPETPAPPRTIPSATVLQEAGVQFVTKKAESFLDIEFNNGVMSIPELVIYDGTYSLFKNLIAFEQCYLKNDTPFTNYAIFMDYIINTSNDVEILSNKKIILHGLGSHEEVALLFNKLCKGVVRDDENNYLSQLFKQVTDYSGTVWHTWRANFLRDYCRNPWTVISLVAALILLSLTIIQTVFTILPYVH